MCSSSFCLSLEPKTLLSTQLMGKLGHRTEPRKTEPKPRSLTPGFFGFSHCPQLVNTCTSLCSCQSGESGARLASPIPPPRRQCSGNLTEDRTEEDCPSQEPPLGRRVATIHSCPYCAWAPPIHRKPCFPPPAYWQGRICSFNNAGFLQQPPLLLSPLQRSSKLKH